MSTTELIAQRAGRKLLAENFLSGRQITAEACLDAVLEEIYALDRMNESNNKTVIQSVMKESERVRFKTRSEQKVFENIAACLIVNHTSGRKRSVFVEAHLQDAFEASRTRRFLTERSESVLFEGWFGDAVSKLAKGVRNFVYKIPGAKAIEKNQLRKWTAKKIWGKLTGSASGDNWADPLLDAYLDALDRDTEERLGEKWKKLGKLKDQVTDKLDSIVDEKGNKFPNVEKNEQFEEGLKSVLDYYVKIVNAAGHEANIEGFPDNPETEFTEMLSAEIANDVIKDLRIVLEKASDDLLDLYLKVKENKVSASLSHLIFEDDADAEKQQFGQYGNQTREMKELQSNLLPAAAALLGLSGLSAGALAQLPGVQQTVQTLLANLGATKNVQQAVQQTSATLTQTGNVLGGEGVTQTLHRLTGVDMSPGAPIANFEKAWKMVGGGSAVDGIKSFVDSGVLPEANAQSVAESFLSSNGATGTISQLSGQIGKTGPLRQVTGAIVRPGIKTATQYITKKIPSVSLAAIAGAGTAAMAVGAGALAVGSIIKLLRMAGAEDSRASYISTLLTMLKDVEPNPMHEKLPPPEVEPPGPEDEGGGPDVEGIAIELFDDKMDMLTGTHRGTMNFVDGETGKPKKYPGVDEGAPGETFKNLDEYPQLLRYVNSMFKVGHRALGPITRDMFDSAIEDGSFTLYDKREKSTGSNADTGADSDTGTDTGADSDTGTDTGADSDTGAGVGGGRPRLGLVRLDDDGVKIYRTSDRIGSKKYKAIQDLFKQAQSQAITGRNTSPSIDSLETVVGSKPRTSKSAKDLTYKQMVGRQGIRGKNLKADTEIEPYFTLDGSALSDIYLKKKAKRYPSLGKEYRGKAKEMLTLLIKKFTDSDSKLSRSDADKIVNDYFGEFDKAKRDKVVNMLVTYGLVKESIEDTDKLILERWQELAGILKD